MRSLALSIVENLRQAILILDEQMRIVSANGSYYRSYGGDAGSVEGQCFCEIAGGRWNHPELNQLISGVLAHNRSFVGFEMQCRTAQPPGAFFLVDVCCLKPNEDGPPLALLTIEEITEKRRAWQDMRDLNAELERRVGERTQAVEQANRELKESNQKLASTNRELEAFCYSVSHDLRAPLRAVDGFSQELLHGYADKLDEKGQHYLKRVRAATQRMGQLIDDLLKLSRVTRVEMQREQVDLTTLADTVFAALRESEPGRQVSWFARPGLMAYCDAQLMRVVLENLLGNALKFTGKQPKAAIAFDGVEIAGQLTYVVRDDGAGFDMRYADKLFGAFQRLHSDREFPGTGIGLATVQRVIHRHGGEVYAESEPGRGAAFYFTLPDGGHQS